jgi:nucleotide-binding universal stress UspA family protein
VRTVLAAIDNSAAARPVLAAAAAFADLLDVEVAAVRVRENGDRNARAAAEVAGVPLRLTTPPVISTLGASAREASVAALVLGARAVGAARRPAGHVALELAVSLPKPLVVVPPDAAVPMVLRRILVPLSGERTAAAALAETMSLAGERELEVVVLHVYDPGSLPFFTDQPQHELEAWSQEFLRRHCPHPEHVRLEMRIGIPGQHVLQVADTVEADMIALGWSQELGEGHAAVVREVLERSAVPVLLVPVAARPDAAGAPQLSGAGARAGG